MPLRVDLNILNQKGTPAFYSDTFANRPAYGFAGRVFISTDTAAIYEDTGTSWTLISNVSSGAGTLQQVTTNGNTSTNNIVLDGSQLYVNNGASNSRIYYDNASSYPGSSTFAVFGNYTIGGGVRLEVNNNNDTLILNADYTAQFIGSVTAPYLTLSNLAQGGILFASSTGLISQKTANFYWDNVNNRLGIGNNSPGAPLDVHGTGTAAQFNGTGTNNAYIVFQSAGTSKWRIGNTYNAGANTLDIYNSSTASNALSFNITTNAAQFYGNLLINTSTNPGANLVIGRNSGKASITGVTDLSLESIGADPIYLNVYSNAPIYVGPLSTGIVYSNNHVLTNLNPSDISLKNTINPINYGLSEILKLSPKTFYYNSDLDKKTLKYGFIAQEVKEIMPDIARSMNDGTNTLGLETEGIYTTLIKAIQELNDKIEKLQNN
jgi:hypothetical protein